MSNPNTDVARIQSRFFGLTPKEQAKIMENANIAIQMLRDANVNPKCLDAIMELQTVTEDLMTYARTLAAHERPVSAALAHAQERRNSGTGGNRRGAGGSRRGKGGSRRPHTS